VLESPPVKGLLIKLLAGLLLGAAIAFSARWLYFSQNPKTPTVALDGVHGIEFLDASCQSVQREHDRILRMPTKEKFTHLYYAAKPFLTCQNPAREMNVSVENQLMTALAANPMCGGIRFFQGYYDPKDSPQKKDFSAAEWRLSLDLVASSETGGVVLEPSLWTLTPTSQSGSLRSMDKAAADICTIVKKGK